MAAKKKSKALTTGWKDQLAIATKAGKAPKEKPATVANKIGTKGGKFHINGKTTREIAGVVLGYAMHNTYYDTPFNEKEVTPPACFAIGFDEELMKSHEKSPNPQGHACFDCPLNQWESAETGRGKACTNRRVIALVPYDKGAKEHDVKLLTLSPTSINNWKDFVNDVEDQGLELMQCAVLITFDDDSTAAYPPIKFELVEVIKDNKFLNAVGAKIQQAYKMLEAPYNTDGYKKSKTKKKKAVKKKAVKKKRSKMS